jgi:hypothetical protein
MHPLLKTSHHPHGVPEILSALLPATLSNAAKYGTSRDASRTPEIESRTAYQNDRKDSAARIASWERIYPDTTAGFNFHIVSKLQIIRKDYVRRANIGVRGVTIQPMSCLARIWPVIAFCSVCSFHIDGSGVLSRGGSLLGKQPMSFVENRGQWPASTKFAAHKGTFSADLRQDGISLRQGASGVFRLRFEGASDRVRLTGEQPLPERYHFYLGNDPGSWREGVRGFGSVLYKALYDGVDLRVRDAGGRLEYDLILQPGVDLGRVILHAEGATRLAVSGDGSMEIETTRGSVKQTAPRTWQVLPDGTRQPLQSRFRLLDRRRYGFDVVGRSSALPTVVDPGLEWSTFLGGSSVEYIKGVAIARDGSGDVLVTGGTSSADFPQSSVVTNSQHVFVARFDSTGSLLRYVTFLHGSAATGTYVGRLAADAAGGVAISGDTNDPTFPVTAGAFRTSLSGNSDAWVVRLNSAGVMGAATFLGGSGDEGASFTSRGIGFDPSGSVVVTGVTLSPDFPTTTGAYDRTFSGSTFATETFLARLSPDLKQLTYGTFYGATGQPWVHDMAVDPAGYITLVGQTIGGLPTTANALDKTWGGAEDAFVARFKLDSAGVADLKYSSYLGGSNRDFGWGLAYDPANPALVTVVGYPWQDFFSPDFPTTAGSVRPTPLAHTGVSTSNPYVQEGFATRFRFQASGTVSMVWSTFLGGSTWDHATDVAIDSAGGAIVLGGTRAFDFPTTRGAFDRTLGGVAGYPYDCFVSRISADGSQLLYSTFFGGNGLPTPDMFHGVECDSPNTTGESHLVYAGGDSAILVGETTSPDLRVTPGAFDTSYAPGPTTFQPAADVFIARLSLLPDASGDLTVAAPVLVSPADGASMPGTTNVTFTWNAVPDPSGIEAYNYQLAAKPDFSEPSIAYRGSVSGTSLNPGPLALVTWYWRIQAADRAGNLSAWSQPFTVHLQNAPPPSSAPTLVSPANGASVALPVALDWSDVSGATSYVIEIDNSSSMSDPLILAQIVTSSQAAIGNLPAGQLWWRVRAMNSGGTGPASATRSFTVQSGTAPALSSVSLSPATVVGGNSTTGTVTLSAAAPTGGAAVALSDNSSAVSTPASVTVNAGATTGSFTITTTSVTSSTSATITATWNGVSETAGLTVTPPTSSVGTPSLISPQSDARFSPGQTITFDWSDVSGAASYELQIDDSQSFSVPLTLAQSTTVSRFSTNSLPELRMWWRVRAVSSSGAKGAWSAIRRFEVKR